jgi:hypothetical protein
VVICRCSYGCWTSYLMYCTSKGSLIQCKLLPLPSYCVSINLAPPPPKISPSRTPRSLGQVPSSLPSIRQDSLGRLCGRLHSNTTHDFRGNGVLGPTCPTEPRGFRILYLLRLPWGCAPPTGSSRLPPANTPHEALEAINQPPNSTCYCRFHAIIMGKACCHYLIAFCLSKSLRHEEPKK